MLKYIPLSLGEKNTRPFRPRPFVCSFAIRIVLSKAPWLAIFFARSFVDSTLLYKLILSISNLLHLEYFKIPGIDIISFSLFKDYPLFVEDDIIYPSFFSSFIPFHIAVLETPIVCPISFPDIPFSLPPNLPFGRLQCMYLLA